MSIARTKNGRLRVNVWVASEGREVSAAKVLGLKPQTWPDNRAGNRAAKKVETDAYAKLHAQAGALITVKAWRERWTTDPLFATRRSESTMMHNRERTKAFAQRYGDQRLMAIGDDIVAEWLAGGKRNSQVPALRAMFADATSREAGRLISINPFANLGISKSKGRKGKQLPSLERLENMLKIAWEITPPSLAGYLEFAGASGPRPGEVDGLLKEKIDWAAREIHIDQQWNAKLHKFTPPKSGPYTIALVPRAAEVLRRLPPGDSPYVFETLRGHHYTPSTRTHHWNRVRCASGLTDFDLYEVTRHFFGWYALNVLRLPPHVIAIQLGHKDGGKLVIELYGHLDEGVARERIREAYDEVGQLRMLRPIRGAG
jgi:integrase